MNDIEALQTQDYRRYDVAEPEMGRMAVEPSMPQHDGSHAPRLIGWLAQRPAAERGPPRRNC